MRVGDRRVRKLKNEAVGNRAVQPRLFFRSPYFQPWIKGDRRGVLKQDTVAWIAIVPLFLVLATALTIRTIGLRPAPPVLQTFVHPPTKQPLPLVSKQRTKNPEPLIRVNVTPGGVDSLQLELRGRCDVASLETKKKLADKLPTGSLNVTSTKGGLKIGTRQFATIQLELIPEDSPSIRVNGHLYRGRMRLFRRTDGKVSAVNVLPIEEYLASVVDSEMPTKFPEAARQAQSIVARTYALYQAERAEPTAVYDLLASQRSQKYLGVEYLDRNGRRLAGESDSSRRAVAATRGIVCQRNDKLFCTYYSAVCGGQTTHGPSIFKDAVDVVRSVPCEWCRESPHYRWTTEVTHEDFQKRILNRGNDELQNNSIRAIHQEVAPGVGLVSQFKIDDGQKSHSVNGVELRERLPPGKLSSPHFFMKLEKDRVVFEGRGHGHGVGFCQWGAKGQAEAGRDCLEIVRHYYPGVEISELNY
jgi:stage II sporulation protein D